MLPALIATAALALPGPTVAQSLDIAYRANPQAPCVGFVTVKWDALHGFGGVANGIAILPNGTWFLRGCWITLDPALNTDPAVRCDVIVHEVKHLAGYRHTATGVMAAVIGQWPACHQKSAKTRKATRTVKLHRKTFDSQ